MSAGDNGGGAAAQHVVPQMTPVTASTALAEFNGRRCVLLVLHTVVGPMHFGYDAGGLERLIAILQRAQHELTGGIIIPDVFPPQP